MKKLFGVMYMSMLLLTILVSVGMPFPQSAGAATQYVNNNADDGPGSLRFAVSAASTGDTIVFVNVTGTIVLNTLIVITKSLTINGPGADNLTISGNFNTRLFSISSPGPPITVALSGLTLFGGYAVGSGGCFVNSLGTVTLTNCSVLSCTANAVSNNPNVAFGGAIYNTGSLTATGCLFKFNTVHGQDNTSSGTSVAGGGAIYNFGKVDVINSTFATNHATGGSGINGPGAAGSGAALFNDGSATIYNCFFRNNVAVGGNSTGNSYLAGEGDGGAILNNGDCVVSGSTFVQNSTLGGSNRNSNGGNGEGGGILNNAFASLFDCTLTANTAQGGSYPYQPGDLNPGRPGNAYGGGVASNGSQYLAVSNCTLSGNLAIGGTNFFVGKGFGGNAFAGGTLTLFSTILSDGIADSYPDTDGAFTSQGNNLIKNPTGGTGFLASDLVNVDPRLGPLQNNGGPTPTMALLPGSPAIDAGMLGRNLPADQRGLPRPYNLPGVPNTNGSDGTDIGAYELRPSDHSDFNGDSFADLVLQNSTAQQVAFWFTNGPTITGGAYALSGPNPITLPPNWQVVATGDFNGDGTPDLVLDNTSTGQIAFWFTSGNTITAGAYATSNGVGIGVPAGWQIVGAGDFNGDGQPDLVLQNPTAHIAAIWTMNGTNVTSGAYVTTGGSPINLPPGWQIVGTGDFNGDGQSDLVLDNPSNGQIAIWMMSGFSVVSGSYLTNGGAPFLLPAGWQIAGVGDYNGDGQPDLVLQNLSSRLIAFWYVGGTSFIGSSYALTGSSPIALPPGWQVAGPR